VRLGDKVPSSDFLAASGEELCGCGFSCARTFVKASRLWRLSFEFCLESTNQAFDLRGNPVAGSVKAGAALNVTNYSLSSY